jgi:hypothetical protein
LRVTAEEEEMNKLLVFGLLLVGCKPGDKTGAPESPHPVGYSNHMSTNPPQVIAGSNNIYTRGPENKTANPAEVPGASNRAADVDRTTVSNHASGRP